MRKYVVTVGIKSQVIHAKLLGEWHYGIGSMTNLPTKLVETQPPTPEQQRVNQLKQQLDTARLQQKHSKLNQQQIKLNQQRTKLNK